LTYQELFVLTKLREKEEKQFESLQGRHLMIHKRFYRKFKTQLSEEIRITEDEVLSIFIRLGSTGCINFDKNRDQFNQVQDSIATYPSGQPPLAHKFNHS
jgi:transcription initiation factor IIE alpha subunit